MVTTYEETALQQPSRRCGILWRLRTRVGLDLAMHARGVILDVTELDVLDSFATRTLHPLPP